MKADFTKAYLGQRQILGGLGIALPFLVILFGLLGENNYGWYYSISATFYANSGPVFIALMGAVGIFLISYGVYCFYTRLDRIVNVLPGVFALLISFFPCGATILEKVGILHIPTKISALIHNISACIFFLLLSFNILFLFTKTAGKLTKKKIVRNRLYRVCGTGILFFIASQAIMTMAPIGGPYTLINETGMLLCFGIAWLVKGETLLRDII